METENGKRKEKGKWVTETEKRLFAIYFALDSGETIITV